MEEAASIRVFLLDDHEVVRRGVRDLLESAGGIEVVGEASTAAEAVARVPAVHPDVAVLDVRLPDGSGVEVCRDLRAADPNLRCMMLTSFDDDEALLDAIVAGAVGLRAQGGARRRPGVQRAAHRGRRVAARRPRHRAGHRAPAQPAAGGPPARRA